MQRLIADKNVHLCFVTTHRLLLATICATEMNFNTPWPSVREIMGQRSPGSTCDKDTARSRANYGLNYPGECGLGYSGFKLIWLFHYTRVRSLFRKYRSVHKVSVCLQNPSLFTKYQIDHSVPVCLQSTSSFTKYQFVHQVPFCPKRHRKATNKIWTI